MLRPRLRNRETTKVLGGWNPNPKHQLKYLETKALLQNLPMPDAVSVLVKDRDGGD
jgi:hypothetical protein